jgi:succinate dehydrogenase / fumarate reductase cytochrome b subunit
MTTPPPALKARPLSPHLQIYKPQLTTGMSIFHRMTGVALAFGLPVFVAWLVALAKGPEAYGCFDICARSLIGQALLFGWCFAFFYHFFCGIRHLLWDAGYFLDIKGVYSTGRIVLGISLFLTLGLWVKLYWIKLYGVMS